MGAVVLPVTRLCGTVVLGFPLGCRGGLELRFWPCHSIPGLDGERFDSVYLGGLGCIHLDQA
jgi:hypothetical protein